ncbi:hypothetical protein [Amycolatopsis granulosa]|uniref:hypothetical protein n=1 Tax=Amycolatopsis granulosa TaxID=185684 RepID=UPI00141E4E7F|nr:hypothetical protein [Amycolatopsis granulosa]NIH87386.1 hypothetical protein [Amycolatopsis granulosa]
MIATPAGPSRRPKRSCQRRSRSGAHQFAAPSSLSTLSSEVATATRTTATTSAAAEAMAAPPAAQLRLMVTGAAAIFARVAPVLEVVRSVAAVDPEIAEMWRANLDQRRTVIQAFAASLVAKTPLRGDISARRAADIALATLSPEVYHLLVHESGWSTEDWTEWAADALVRQLLPSS